MSRKRLRLGVVGLAALVLIAVAAMMGGLRGSTSSSQPVGAELGEGPPALAKHLAKLRQALPPNGGMAEEGPGGAADGEFAERAYPDATISVAEMEGAAMPSRPQLPAPVAPVPTGSRSARARRSTRR